VSKEEVIYVDEDYYTKAELQELVDGFDAEIEEKAKDVAWKEQIHQNMQEIRAKQEQVMVWREENQ